MPFQLHSPFQPAGDQPQAIEALAQGLRDGKKQQVLMGVTGSGKTFTMANVIAQFQRPTLVLSHNKTLAAQLYSEFREFFPANAVHYFVSYYDYYQPEAYIPQRDIYIEKDASINQEIDRLRLASTSALVSRRDVIIVASVSSIYGLGSPDDYRQMMVGLRVGDSVDRDDMLLRLVDIQYERNDVDFSRGKFRVRGDCVEVWPGYEEYGYRIELTQSEAMDGITFHPKKWQAREFEPVSTALFEMMQATGNNALLRRPGGTLAIRLVRLGDADRENRLKRRPAANNDSNGKMNFNDLTFMRGTSGIRLSIWHEFAHNWGDPQRCEVTFPSNAKAQQAITRFFQNTDKLGETVRPYGKTNKKEDWATSFSAYMHIRNNLDYVLDESTQEARNIEPASVLLKRVRPRYDVISEFVRSFH